MNRPQVSVFDSKTGEVKSQTALPDVFLAPIRTDIVTRMHSHLKLNLRQPYAVSRYAGHNVAAESWGTGRAVSRIPRVPGSGTHRAGQGAFGNMCRGGRMFSPSKTWRRWMHKVKKNERRYATASAIAASGVSVLVMGRGHKVEKLNEVPLVVSDDLQSIQKTKEAMAFLKRVNAREDCLRAKNSKKIRPGRGKSRNRRYTQRLGPLVVYKENKGIYNAFRNIPGVDTCSVDQLNLLQLAPGGTVGRFIIWTESAFKDLNSRFGTYGNKGDSRFKQRCGAPYRLPRGLMLNSDIDRISNSDEVQNVLRPRKFNSKKTVLKKNPLKNLYAMVKLNPNALQQRRNKILSDKKNAERNKLAREGKLKPTTPQELKSDKMAKKYEKVTSEAKARLNKVVVHGENVEMPKKVQKPKK